MGVRKSYPCTEKRRLKIIDRQRKTRWNNGKKTKHKNKKNKNKNKKTKQNNSVSHKDTSHYYDSV